MGDSDDALIFCVARIHHAKCMKDVGLAGPVLMFSKDQGRNMPSAPRSNARGCPAIKGGPAPSFVMVSWQAAVTVLLLIRLVKEARQLRPQNVLPTCLPNTAVELTPSTIPADFLVFVRFVTPTTISCSCLEEQCFLLDWAISLAQVQSNT